MRISFNKIHLQLKKKNTFAWNELSQKKYQLY